MNILFTPFGPSVLSTSFQVKTSMLQASITTRAFPDRETYLRINTDVEGADTFVFASLNNPNSKIILLLLLADALKTQGAKSVTLIAPYLAYMRHDMRFSSGEALSPHTFAKILSPFFQKIITVDPHLHRIKSLNEIYKTKTTVVHAASAIADWIQQNVPHPFIIGPDSESAQWVTDIAKQARLPHTVLQKVRKSDNDVEIQIDSSINYHGKTPVLIDDIISTAGTMVTTVNQLKQYDLSPPICIGIHPIFATDAYHELLASGISKVVTCNTIDHISNGIDLADVIINFLKLK